MLVPWAGFSALRGASPQPLGSGTAMSPSSLDTARDREEEDRDRDEREGREEEESVQLGSTEGETSRKKGKISPRAISFG